MESSMGSPQMDFLGCKLHVSKRLISGARRQSAQSQIGMERGLVTTDLLLLLLYWGSGGP
jgi:hypothetical protein